MAFDSERIKAMDPVERFLYWCEERHRVYLRRLDGQPKPWTDDALLQQFYFTNVYRELDKTTKWFATHMREPLRLSPDVLLATVIFRWFNYIPTGELLLKHNLHRQWNEQRTLDILGPVRERRDQVFTGAFMINSPPGEPKLEAICRRISEVWEDRDHLLGRWWINGESPTMEGVKDTLTDYDGLGGFMAYEIVCDLRFTYLLEKAPDILTWANPGPGATRGMYRVLGREIKNKSNSTSPKRPPEWAAMIISLRERLDAHMRFHFGDRALPVEAREVEMSLCEYDKYVRLLFGEGQSKRRYAGV